MTTQEELEVALGASIDCMRIAAQSLRNNDRPVLADMLSEQADKNMTLLLPWARR
jgi:hypothetical protein